jgi:preprotein translocase subunit SecY
MQQNYAKISLFLKDSSLVKRVFFTLLILSLFRALANIPIPGVDQGALTALFTNSQFGQFLGLINIFSGGGLTQLSIMMLGIGPYITASIIMQLSTIMSPRLKAMYKEEGEVGRKKFSQYSRLLTVPLAILQGMSFLTLLERQNVITPLGFVDTFVNIAIITAGSMLLLWLSDLISEYGVGNGTSMIIFGGIASAFLPHVFQTVVAFDVSQIPTYVAFAVVGILVILGTVFVTEAERPVPVTYAKRVRGNKVYGGISTYLPLRLNQSGVLPIIFALSLLLLPQVLLNLISLTNQPWVSVVTEKVNAFMQNNWAYAGTYFVLVVLFTYFYTAVTFDPQQISTDLQKNGAFIPGVRPGDSTMTHLAHIITRITLVGALFLGLVAIIPIAVRVFTNITTLTIGGTSILIVVSVVLDLLKKIGAQLTAKEY